MLDFLTKNGVVSQPGCIYAKQALGHAFYLGDAEVVCIFLDKGISIDKEDITYLEIAARLENTKAAAATLDVLPSYGMDMDWQHRFGNMCCGGLLNNRKDVVRLLLEAFEERQVSFEHIEATLLFAIGEADARQSSEIKKALSSYQNSLRYHLGENAAIIKETFH
ncbi:hypothetical protein BBP40_002762 [Aspergillus hancockii]|nr:hypothetical protein BBP40_002762 [Aspergillus hancockii]